MKIKIKGEIFNSVATVDFQSNIEWALQHSSIKAWTIKNSLQIQNVCFKEKLVEINILTKTI